MRVHHPRHDREARAVDALSSGRRLPDREDPAALHDDVGAGELPRADIDETVLEDECQLPAAGIADGIGAAPASAPEAMSITASLSIGRASSVCGNPSRSRTFAERATATRPV